MAVITATRDEDSYKEGKEGFVISDITNADTVTPVLWQGGSGVAFVRGTPDGATLQFTFGKSTTDQESLSTLESPSGGRFTNATGQVGFNLSYGYIGMTFSGGGGSQNLEVTIRPIAG
jgi:hypothetical protein